MVKVKTHPRGRTWNLRWPPPAVSAAHQLASSNICSPNESSSLFVFFFFYSLAIIPPALQLHISPLCQFYLFFSHTDEEFLFIQICKSSVHIWLFFPPSPIKLCAPSPSCHSSLRTRVHILSVSQSFELHNTLLPCLVKHANMLNCGVKTWFTSTPLCW